MQRPHHFSVTLIALAVFAELVVNCTGTLRRNGSTCVSTPCGSIVTTSTSCHTQQPVSQRPTVRFDMRRVRQRTSTVSRLASNPPQTTVGGTPTSPHQLTQPLPCSPRCSSPFASTARDVIRAPRFPSTTTPVARVSAVVWRSSVMRSGARTGTPRRATSDATDGGGESGWKDVSGDEKARKGARHASGAQREMRNGIASARGDICDLGR